MSANVAVGVSDPPAVVIYARRAFRIGGIIRSDSERAIDAADDAADRTADDRADGPRRVVAHIGAMGGALGNALRLRRER
jgi:hypothetical protein